MTIQNGSKVLSRHIGHTVVDIMTPTDDLYEWTNDNDRTVLQRAREDGISFLPVRDENQIVGLVKREELEVSETIPLTAEWLIAADTPILHLIELFAAEPNRIFMVLQSSQIVGLVAPADLNKVPARASIYLLTAHIESQMAELVRKKLNEDERELEHLLSSKNLEKLRDEQAKSKADDFGLSLYQYLYLADLITIIAKHQTLRADLGFTSRGQVERSLDFTEVRNRVSHPTGLMLYDRKDLQVINSACKEIILLSEAISKIM